jgi:hypothetical protein
MPALRDFFGAFRAADRLRAVGRCARPQVDQDVIAARIQLRR